MDKDLQERKAAGAYPTTEFIVEDLKEYNVEATDFSNSANSSEAPFAPANEVGSPWDFGK